MLEKPQSHVDLRAGRTNPPGDAGLRDETTIPGQYGSAYPVHQRMAQACTPALSVGVIDNFEVAWARGFGALAVGAEPAAANTPF
jgi:hypothetical protein